MRILFIIILLIVGWIPLVTKFAIIENKIGSLKYIAYPIKTIEYDFLLYYRSKFFILLTIILFLFYILEYKKKKNYIDRYNLLIFLLFILTILSYIFSPFKEVSLFGINERYEGTLSWISYLVFLWVLVNRLTRRKEIRYIFYAMVFSLVIIHLIGILQMFGYDIFKMEFIRSLLIPVKYKAKLFVGKMRSHYVYSLFGNSNYAGTIAALSMPLFIIKFTKEKNKIKEVLFYLCYLLSILELRGSGSRAGLLGVIIILFLYLIFYFKQNKIRVGISIFTFILITYLPFLPGKRALKELNPNNKVRVSKIEKISENKLKIEMSSHMIVLDFAKPKIEIKIDGEKKHLEANRGITLIRVKKDHKWKEDLKVKVLTPFQFVVQIDNVNFPILKTKVGIKTIGLKGEIEDIYMAERLRYLDGYERKGSGRVYIWSRIIPKLRKVGIFGSGANTTSLIFPQNDNVGKALGFEMENNISIFVDKPHNLYINLILEFGPIYLFIFLTLLLTLFKDSFKIIKNKDKKKFNLIDNLLIINITTIGYLVVMIFNDSTVLTSIYFFAYLGLGIVIVKKNK